MESFDLISYFLGLVSGGGAIVALVIASLVLDDRQRRQNAQAVADELNNGWHDLP